MITSGQLSNGQLSGCYSQAHAGPPRWAQTKPSSRKVASSSRKVSFCCQGKNKMERMSSHTTTHILNTKQVTTTLYKQCGRLPGDLHPLMSMQLKPRMSDYLGHNHRHSAGIIFTVSYFHKLGPYFHCLRL